MAAKFVPIKIKKYMTESTVMVIDYCYGSIYCIFRCTMS